VNPKCHFILVDGGQCCDQCGFFAAVAGVLHRNCDSFVSPPGEPTEVTVDPALLALPRPSDAEVIASLGLDPTLVGNRLEALFKAVGIPPCGGCTERRDWLNAAHSWLRATFS